MLKVNTLFLNFINSLNLAHKHKHKEFVFKANKLIINFCLFLQQNGLIFGYSLHTLNNTLYITVLLKYYRNTPIFSQLKHIPTTAKTKVLTAAQVSNLFFKNAGFLIISTTMGICFLSKAQEKKIGGVLLAQLFLF